MGCGTALPYRNDRVIDVDFVEVPVPMTEAEKKNIELIKKGSKND